MSNIDTSIPTFLKRKPGEAPIKKSVPKKAGSLVAKAAKQRDELAAKAKAAAAASASKPNGADKPKVKSAPKSTERAGKYDWTKAEAMAKKGELPTLPPFNSYKPHIRKFWELARKKDVAGIKKLSAEYKNEKGARANMFRYRDLLLVALKA